MYVWVCDGCVRGDRGRFYVCGISIIIGAGGVPRILLYYLN